MVSMAVCLMGAGVIAERSASQSRDVISDSLYVDNVYMGATAVSDSLVEIPCYILYGVAPDAEVEILAFYERKLALDAVSVYQVWSSR